MSIESLDAAEMYGEALELLRRHPATSLPILCADLNLEGTHSLLIDHLRATAGVVEVGRSVHGTVFAWVPTLRRFIVTLSERTARAGLHVLSEETLALCFASSRTAWKAVVDVSKVDDALASPAMLSRSAGDQWILPIALLLTAASHKGARRLHAVLPELVERTCCPSDWERDSYLAMDDALARFKPRVRPTILLREGLLGQPPVTLEGVGEKFGVTRERIRQIERGFWARVREPGDTGRLMARSFLYAFYAQGGRRFVDTSSSVGRRELFLADCVEITSIEVPSMKFALIAADGEAVQAMLDTIRDAVHDGSELTVRSLAPLGLSATDSRLLLQRARLHYLRKRPKWRYVVEALRSLGRPAHFRDVHRRYLEMFPDKQIGEHSLHSMLGRLDPVGVVWVGLKGTYALREWGYERPSQRLFDLVADVIEELWEATGKPVPYAEVANEVEARRRLVGKNSIAMAAHLGKRNKYVGNNSFVPASKWEDPRRMLPLGLV